MRISNWLVAGFLFAKDLFNNKDTWYSSELTASAFDELKDVEKVYKHHIHLSGIVESDLKFTVDEAIRPVKKILLTKQNNPKENGVYHVAYGVMHGVTIYHLERTDAGNHSW